jgi:hypothetical protein
MKVPELFRWLVTRVVERSVGLRLVTVPLVHVGWRRRIVSVLPGFRPSAPKRNVLVALFYLYFVVFVFLS